MKIMTYNILGEDDYRIPVSLQAIKQQAPDFLAIQEANFFPNNNGQYLKQFSKELNLPYYDLSLAGEYNYHVASFSKFPFKATKKLKQFRNACLETVIDTILGKISICNTHLTPYTEDNRLTEIKLAIAEQKKYPNKIILGDLNSLSPDDGYNFEKDIQNDSQHRKFTKAGKLQFEVIPALKAAGYTDTALRTGINHQNTVPTGMIEDKAHGQMRLDYIFVSELLKESVRQVSVLKNELTNQASDHYPLLLITY